MDKSISNFDKFFNVDQEGVENLFRYQLHTWEDLTRLQSEFGNLWLECLNAQMQRMASAKNLNDICATETGLMTEYSMKFSDNLRKVYETLLNSQKEFMECCSVPESLYSQPQPARPEKAEKEKALEANRNLPRSKAAS